MRYIVDSDGYLLSVSFGAQIECGGVSCTEYTGAVPDGYDSLEDWYTQECEKLYRWMIVSGNLTLDSAAIVAEERPIVDRVVERGEKDGWTYRIWASGDQECWFSGKTESLDTSSFRVHSGFYYTSIGLTFPLAFASPPAVVVDGGSQDILNFLRISHVYKKTANIWVYGLENLDTDTVIYYHAYAKGKAITRTTAVLGSNVLGLMRLGEGG